MDCADALTCDYCFYGKYTNWDNSICSDICLDTEEVLPGYEAIYGFSTG